MKIESLFQPSILSLSGQALLLLEKRKKSCICEIFKRCAIVLLFLLTSAIDLLICATTTITIYPFFKLGLDHLANLTSSLALPILTLAVPFGYTPKVDERRLFFSEGDWEKELIQVQLDLETDRFKTGKIRDQPFRRQEAERKFQCSDIDLNTSSSLLEYFSLNCDPNLHNQEGETPLLCAMRVFRNGSSAELISLMNATHRNIEIEKCDAHGFDPLTHALLGTVFQEGRYQLHSRDNLELAKTFLRKWPNLKLPKREAVIELCETVEGLSMYFLPAVKGFYDKTRSIPQMVIDLLKNSHNTLVKLVGEELQESENHWLSRWHAKKNAKLLLNRYNELQGCQQREVKSTES